MDLLRKYTGEKMFYELDEDFIITLESYPLSYSASIILQLENTIPYMEVKKEGVQTLAGVVRKPKPFYYVIKYLYFPNNSPYFFKLSRIDSDDFLDYYNDNQLLKYELNYNKVPSR